MSVVYCSYCDLYIDTDYDVEHFILVDDEEICERKYEANKNEEPINDK